VFVEKNNVMDQHRMPLWEGLKKHNAEKRVRLHVPGHGGGRFLPPELREPFAATAHFDLTELPGLDDLYRPDGIIGQAQDLAASLWGADKTYFLVNGSSAGVMAMLLAACNPGTTVLVPRNAHGSVYHGLILSGAVPHYLPVADGGDNFPLNVTVEAVRDAFMSCPQAAAVLITSPSYYGVSADVAAIADVAREYDALVLLDEAHGAHFGFHPELPADTGHAVDLRVQSWHKSLGALTPGAVLHRHGTRVDTRRLESALQWLQTSSPPYPLLLSLDAARQQMALWGEQLWSGALQAAAEVRNSLGQRITLLERSCVSESGFDLDITRLTILSGKAGINGLEAAAWLADAGIDVEMAFPDHLLALINPGIKRDDLTRVIKLLPGILSLREEWLPCHLPALPQPQAVITPRQASLCPVRAVMPEDAVGLIAAAAVTAYPPGIPVLAPGERITQEIYIYIQAAARAGVNLRGPDRDGRLFVCREGCE
jgi:arginine decarboxylase